MSKKKNGFREVRGKKGKLLFRYDPNRQLIEIKQKGGRVQVVNLQKLEKQIENV